MITISKNFLDRPAIICVEISDFRFTTHHSNITIGGDVFYANQDVSLTLGMPQFTSDIDRDLYTINFSDSKHTLQTNFNGGWDNATVSIVSYYINTSHQVELTEPFIIYEGFVSSYSYNIDTSAIGEVVATITCSNLMSSLDATDPFYTSAQFINSIVTGDSEYDTVIDTSYDQIYEGSGNIVLKWGKV